MKPLLEAKAQIDWFMDTLPKKQQAVYTQIIEDTKATQAAAKSVQEAKRKEELKLKRVERKIDPPEKKPNLPE
jgi:hypothetical protein